MVIGPELVDFKDKEYTGFLMYFFLMMGIFFGGIIATFGFGKLF